MSTSRTTAPRNEEPLRAASTAFARDSGIAVLAGWSAYLIGAVGGLVLARILLPEGKGAYSLLFLGGILTGAVLTLGTELWATKEASRTGITDEVAGVVRRHLEMTTSVSLFAFASYAALLFILTDQLPSASVTAVVSLAITSVWSVSLAGLLRGARQMKALLYMQVAAPLVFIVGLLLWAWLGDLTVAGSLVLATLGRLAAIALGPWRAVLDAPSADLASWFSILRTHISSSAGVLVEFASYRIDVLFIAVFLTTTDVGLYSVALPLSELLWLLPNALAQVLLPHVAASGTGGAAATATAIRLTLGFSIIGAVGLALLAEPLIEVLYGSDYAGAATALPLLALGAVILSAWKLVTADLLARGDSSIRARGGLIAIAVLAVAVPLMTTTFGLTGAAGATALAYSAAAAHGLFRWQKLPTACLTDLIPGRIADLALLARTARGGSRSLAGSTLMSPRRKRESS